MLNKTLYLKNVLLHQLYMKINYDEFCTLISWGDNVSVWIINYKLYWEVRHLECHKISNDFLKWKSIPFMEKKSCYLYSIYYFLISSNSRWYINCILSVWEVICFRKPKIVNFDTLYEIFRSQDAILPLEGYYRKLHYQSDLNEKWRKYPPKQLS